VSVARVNSARVGLISQHSKNCRSECELTGIACVFVDRNIYRKSLYCERVAHQYQAEK
jgi:hypothetical protein